MESRLIMEKFRIITLDAERMVTQEIRDEDLQQNPQTCNYEIQLRFDLSRYSADREIILHTDYQQTNALFWQLSTILRSEIKSEVERKKLDNDPEGILEHALVYIDFHSIFHREDFFDENRIAKRDTLSKEALLKNDKVVRAYKLIKMFDRGIELSFDGSIYHRFLPFDKSASMTRHSVISFINAELQKRVEPRLMLGMNLSDANIRVEASKYCSYRGLYLTTSTRVDSLKLNEETVVVLSDFIEHIPETDIYTAKLKLSKLKGAHESFDYWEFKKVQKLPKINLFDGEGLLSPDCASAINNYLKCLSKKNKYKFSSSFQIRLPFAKGVLHQVDYVKFFVEELGLPEDNLIVEDFFGIKRDLKKAQIILTRSMFKMSALLKDYCKALNLGDPMKFFFEQFVEYDHALYVVLTDANLQKPGHQEKLNHQFLSTLSLTPENFSALVNQQIKRIKDLPNTLRENFSTSDDDTRDRMFSVLASNDAFFKQNEVKNAVKSMQQNLAFDLGLGKIKVDGTNLWFSCDLLGLLLRIAAERMSGADAEKIKSLRKRTLQPQHFYMPDNKLSLKNNQPYVLLRNPHLSQNEQVLLRAYADDKSLYEKYFSHLKGVVMVSTKSIAALALGGADYDGDYVKIITEFSVIQAVKSLHTLKDGYYKRKLPVIEIPSIKSDISSPPSSVSFEMIVNTFNNQIGYISNLAVEFMSLATKVTTQDEKDKFLRNAAQCTILTGLDIDAAKSGRRPKSNIEELAKQIGKERCVFLDCKDKLEKLKGLQFFTPRVEDDKGKLKLYPRSSKKAFLSITKQKFQGEGLLLNSLPQFHESVAYINLLPQLYLEYLKYMSDYDFKITPTSDLYFEFERPSSLGAKRDGWKEKLDKEKIGKIKILVTTFNAILSLAKRVESWRNWCKSQDRDNFVDVILNIQYDANAVIDGEPVEKAKLNMYSMLEGIVDLSNIEAVLKTMKEKKWHLTPQESRSEKLAEILGINKLPPSVISLLTNFSQNGYLLLYYALLHVRAHLESNTDVWTDIAYVEQRNDSTSLKQGLSVAQEDPKQWKEFYEIYSTYLEKKWTRSVLKSELVKLCRQNLSNIFAGDFNEALKHFWATQSNDQSHKFFWNVFSEREILDNLPKAHRIRKAAITCSMK